MVNIARSGGFLIRANNSTYVSSKSGVRGSKSTEIHAKYGLRIRVYRDLRDIEDVWRSFEKNAHRSCYQRFDFVSAWYNNIGIRNRYSPYIIVGYNSKNLPVFIWPMMVKCRHFFRTLIWAGEKHANYNLGLSSPSFLKQLDGKLAKLILGAAKDTFSFDAAHLYNQPEIWDGVRNSFIDLPHTLSPSFSYNIDLRQGFDAHLRKHRSGKFRKRMRWQARKLGNPGVITYKRARTSEEAVTFIEAHFSQKSTRFLSMGRSNPFAEPGLKDFYLDLATRDPSGDNPPLEIHTMMLDDEYLAFYAGGTSRNRYSAFFNSIDISISNRYSVGDMLLMHLAKDCESRSLDALDLGIGEADYKLAWCSQTDKLFDSFVSFSILGSISSNFMKTTRRLKRLIKQTPILWKLASRFV